MVIDSTAKVEVQRAGHVAMLLAERKPIGLAINITLVELERLALELQQEARRWRDACETDYYAILNVPRTASPSDIKRAYRHKSRQHHPDLSAEHTGDAMQHVNAAYEILSDPVKRQQYDQHRPT